MYIKLSGYVESRILSIIVVQVICGEEVAFHNWYTYISTSSMYRIYRLFKKKLNFEDFLLSCNNRERISLTKYRCANSKSTINYINCVAKTFCRLAR